MKSRWFAYPLLLSLLFVCGCKGDGGGDAPTFLEIVSFNPDSGRDDVQVEIRIGLRVSERIDPSTLTSETFVLIGPGGAAVPSTVAVLDEPNADPDRMGTGALLTPDEPLDVLTEYTVTVTTGLMSTDGKSLEEDFDWSFTTLDAAWGEAEWIEPLGTGNSGQQALAVDEELNAIAVWTLDTEAGGAIYANRYTRVDLWGEDPEPISDAAGDAANPKLAADAAGNAFAVWVRKTSASDPNPNIWANRYDVESGSWGEAALLQEGDVTRAGLPSVAADPSGNAIAVWIQFDEDTKKDVVRAIRYEAGTGWGSAVTIGAPEFTVSTTDVGMDDQGGAVVVWDALAGGVGGGIIRANRYTLGVGWRDLADVEDVKSDDTTTADGLRLDVGANGDAFVVWVQNAPSEGDRNDVYASRFSGGAWSIDPKRIDVYDAGDKSTPDIAVDGTGAAYAVWLQNEEFDAGDRIDNVWLTEYAPGSDWANPVLIEPPSEDPNDDGDATAPRVDSNRVGNVFVVWGQIFGSWPSIWSNRRDPSTSWVAANAERIEDFPEAANGPIIAVDEARHAHALWRHSAAGHPRACAPTASSRTGSEARLERRFEPEQPGARRLVRDRSEGVLDVARRVGAVVPWAGRWFPPLSYRSRSTDRS